jgi:hypothetical protein
MPTSSRASVNLSCFTLNPSETILRTRRKKLFIISLTCVTLIFAGISLTCRAMRLAQIPVSGIMYGLQQPVHSGSSVVFRNFSLTCYQAGGVSTGINYTISGSRVAPESSRAGYFLFGGVKHIVIKDVKIMFFNEGGRAVSLRADKATMTMQDFQKADRTMTRDILSSSLLFSGAVAIIADGARTLTCDKLYWSGATRRFKAKGHCRVGQGGATSNVSECEGNIQLTDITMREASSHRNTLRAHMAF